MSPEGRRVRILLADEQSLFREAVRVVLEGEPDLEVVAEATDGLQAVAEAERAEPDVALLDAELPNCDGVRAAALISQRVPRCRVVVICGDEDQALLVEALEAGATGFLTKDIPLSELIQATRAVHAGETLIPPRMLGPLLSTLIRRRREREEAFRRVARLSPREREVLALLAEGCDNDSIARTLVISPETARTHIQNVLGKLGVHSRLQAAAFVRQTAVLEDLLREPGDGHGRGDRLVPLGRRASGAHRREDTPPDG